MVNKAEVGHFDGALKTIAFIEGDTILSLLTKANLTLNSGQALNNEDGEVVDANSPAVDGETYYIVGNYKQGAVDIKGFTKSSLANAIGDVNVERAEIQKEKAKKILRVILDKKDVLEFNINGLQEELKAINKELKVFYNK